jgi:hypothetical protein
MSQKFVADGVTESAPSTPPSPDALESISALARFEFEPGKSNDGTKVLMVEWEDYSETRDAEGLWQVSWSGKTTVLPADERTAENIRRFYFLLPPGTKIPPHVKLTYQPCSKSASVNKRPQHLTINPLPAIFPPELGVTARTSGRKGVLHTIWAKKRLQALDKEIRQERQYNLEGIALEMAVSEKEWIETNFGIAPKVPALDMSSIPRYPAGPLSAGLASPKSPGGRRLSEKLKGLSLGTSEKDLAHRADGWFRSSLRSHLRCANITFRSKHSQSRNTSSISRIFGRGYLFVPLFPPDAVCWPKLGSKKESYIPSTTRPCQTSAIQHTFYALDQLYVECARKG